MIEPIRQLIVTIIIAILFLLVYTGIMLNIERHHYDELIKADCRNKTEVVRGMAEGYGKTWEDIGSGFFKDINARVKLTTLRLSDQAAGAEFSGDRFDENGMVVRMHDGRAELPPEAEGLFGALSPEMITEEYKQTKIHWDPSFAPAKTGAEASGREEEVFLTSGRIRGDWYYVSWTPVEEYDEYVSSHLSREGLLDALEYDENTELFMISSEEEPGEDSGTILHMTKGLSRYHSISDLGITREALGEEQFTLETDNGKRYICFPIAMENVGVTVVYCNSVEREKAAFLGDILLQILFAGIMLAGLITWCFSVQWLVRKETLSEEQKLRYSPKVVKKRTMRLTVMSTVVVTLFAFMTVLVPYVYQENRIGSNVLELIDKQIEDEEKNSLGVQNRELVRYTRLGETVSSMLTQNPALLTRDKLSEISEAISAEYLILFDGKGEEIACSREYVDFALPTDRSDPFYDFRRLLKGLPSVVKEPVNDMITGETRPFVGIRYEEPGEKDAYGALVIALPYRGAGQTEENERFIQLTKQQIYNRMEIGNRMIMEIDPETHTILSCSREDFVGSGAESLGMHTRDLKERHMGFFNIDGEWYFGISKASGGKLCFYMSDSTMMSRTGLIFALLSGALFLIGYLITAGFAMREYTDENYERYALVMRETSDAYMDRIAERAPSMNSVAETWKNMLPEIKTKTILQILTGILIGVMILSAFGNSPLSAHSAINFVIRGNWTKGINLFAIIAVLVTLCIEYLAYLLVKLVFRMLYTLTDRAGETILRLCRSFINYAMVIGAICVSLNFLGVDTATLLASIGLLSLAISLGAKDIVADILAGLSIVFEKSYNVGDFISIGDFKGKVLEIGIRTTKIKDSDNSVKIISNHQISSVINYSKQNTRCVVKIGVPVDVSLAELRALFEKELPLVKKSNPFITKGPDFEGILEFKGNSMIIGISAEGPHENIYGIKLDLNHLLQSMVERELLIYSNSNITINLEGVAPSAPDDTYQPDPSEKSANDISVEKEEPQTPGFRGKPDGWIRTHKTKIVLPFNGREHDEDGGGTI